MVNAVQKNEITPAIFGNVKANMKIAQEETFGPVIVLNKSKDFLQRNRRRQKCNFLHAFRFFMP